MWNWALCVLPVVGPLFMLTLALLFGPCIINALSKFISSQVQKIKFQLLVREYSLLPTMNPPSSSFGVPWRPYGSTPEQNVPTPPLPLLPHCQEELAR
jgi:hypothetical protein